jgi:hypothetical protein
VLEWSNELHVWSDDQLGAGSDWRAEIESGLAEASIAILLISANFLTSTFVRRTEVPALLERHRREGLVIIPLIAKACAWRDVEWLAQLQVRPADGRPVWRPNGDSEGALATVASEIADRIRRGQRRQTRVVTEDHSSSADGTSLRAPDPESPTLVGGRGRTRRAALAYVMAPLVACMAILAIVSSRKFDWWGHQDTNPGALGRKTDPPVLGGLDASAAHGSLTKPPLPVDAASLTAGPSHLGHVDLLLKNDARASFFIDGSEVARNVKEVDVTLLGGTHSLVVKSSSYDLYKGEFTSPTEGHMTITIPLRPRHSGSSGPTQPKASEPQHQRGPGRQFQPTDRGDVEDL